MYHPDFARLLEHLRRSVKDFALFEAVYLAGLPRRELAKMLGVTERSLRRRLRSVRKFVYKSIGGPDEVERRDNLIVARDYFE